MAEVEHKRKFEWSLKPLDIITRCIVGVTLDFSKKTSISIRLLLFVFGCFIISFNILVNGSRGININNFEWIKEIQNYKNSKQLFSNFPDAFLQFVVDVSFIIFWIIVSLIHFIFLMAVLFSRKWDVLMQILKKIECNEMQFGEEFYLKCRKHYNIAILVSILVKPIKATRSLLTLHFI